MRGCQAAKHFALVGLLKEFIDVFDKICHRTPPNSRRREHDRLYRRQTLIQSDQLSDELQMNASLVESPNKVPWGELFPALLRRCCVTRTREQSRPSQLARSRSGRNDALYPAAMKWRPSSSVTLPASGFIEPCIPSPVKRAPTSADWIFELKMDGYRLMVRRQDDKVRIYSRRWGMRA